MAGKTRTLKYTGGMDKLDMRAVHYDPKDAEAFNSDEARKLIFYRLNSKIDPAAGERQFREGVELPEDIALAVLTDPLLPPGMADVTPAARETDPGPNVDGAPLAPDSAIVTGARPGAPPPGNAATELVMSASTIYEPSELVEEVDAPAKVARARK